MKKAIKHKKKKKFWWGIFKTSPMCDGVFTENLRLRKFYSNKSTDERKPNIFQSNICIVCVSCSLICPKKSRGFPLNEVRECEIPHFLVLLLRVLEIWMGPVLQMRNDFSKWWGQQKRNKFSHWPGQLKKKQKNKKKQIILWFSPGRQNKVYKPEHKKINMYWI